MNKIYMFATCMMWVLFLLYSWLKLSWNVINPMVVYGLTDSNNKLVDNIMQLSAATEEVTGSADQVREMSESSLKYANTVKTAITKIEDSSEDLKQYL